MYSFSIHEIWFNGVSLTSQNLLSMPFHIKEIRLCALLCLVNDMEFLVLVAVKSTLCLTLGRHISLCILKSSSVFEDGFDVCIMNRQNHVTFTLEEGKLTYEGKKKKKS
ncbi:hypothetical protein Bca4012_018746 [Brassica carinata]